MLTRVKLSILSILFTGLCFSQGDVKLRTLETATVNGSYMVSATSGTRTGVWTPTLTIPLSKITGTNTLLPTTTSITVNGVPQALAGSTVSIDAIQSVSGDLVDNTDPYNPVVNLTTAVTDGYLLVSSSGTFTESLISQNTNSVIVGTLPGDQANLIIRSETSGGNPTLRFERNGGTSVGTIEASAFGPIMKGGTLTYSASTAHTFTGTSMTYNGNQVATTNQLPIVTASTNINVTGTTPNYTVTSLVTDATLPTTDVTTNNASTSKHGFLPKLPGSGYYIIKGDGTLSEVQLPEFKELSADAVTTSTTPATMTELTYSLAASSTYEIEGIVFMTCSGTGGLMIAATGPASSVYSVGEIGRSSGTAATVNNTYSDAGITRNFANTLASGIGSMMIKGKVTTTTSGNFIFEISSATGGQTSTAKVGSYIKYTKIR